MLNSKSVYLTLAEAGKKKYINKTMKKVLFVFMLLCISFIAIAQQTISDSMGCGIVESIKFKNGIDTLEFTVLYRSSIPGSQDTRLTTLANRKQISANEYQDRNYESTYVEFMLPKCDRRFMGILNRKIYDRTFVREHISDYQTEIIDLNNLKTYQKVFLKCVVFEDQTLKDRRGSYFLAIIELRPL